MDFRAQELKEKGNAAFEEGRNEDAVRLYTSALDFGASAVLYSNRAAAFLKLDKYDDALRDANSAIGIDPSYIKGFARKANALMMQGKLEEAKKALREGLAVDASSNLLRQKLQELELCAASARSMTAPRSGGSRAPPRLSAAGAEALKRLEGIVSEFGREWAKELDSLLPGPSFGHKTASASVLTSALAVLRDVDDTAEHISIVGKPLVAFWTVISEHKNLTSVTGDTLKASASFNAMGDFLMEAISISPVARAALTKGGRIVAAPIIGGFIAMTTPARRAHLIGLIDWFGEYCATGPLALSDPWGVREGFGPMHPMTVAIYHGPPEVLSLLASKGVPLSSPSSSKAEAARLPLWHAYHSAKPDHFERLLDLGARAEEDMLLVDLCFRAVTLCTCLHTENLDNCMNCGGNKCDAKLRRARVGMLRSLLARQPELLEAKLIAEEGSTWTVLQMAIYTKDVEVVDFVLELGAKPDCASKLSTLCRAITFGAPEVVDLLVNKYKLAEENRQYSDAAIRQIADAVAFAAVTAFAPPARHMPGTLPPVGAAESLKIVDILLRSGLKACWNFGGQNALLTRIHPAPRGAALSEAHTIQVLERFRRAGWNISCLDEKDLKLGLGNYRFSLLFGAYSNKQPAVAEYAIEHFGHSVDEVHHDLRGVRSTLLLHALSLKDIPFARRLLSVHKAKAAYPGWKDTDQPLLVLLTSGGFEDEEAEKLLRLMIANTPDLLEMDCYREKGVPGTRTGTVDWTPVHACASPPKPLCLELLLKTVPAAKKMACQRLTTKDTTGRFVPDTTLHHAVTHASWKCAALLLAHTDALVTERLPCGVSASGDTLYRPSPLEELKKAAVAGPDRPPRALVLAFDNAARRENAKSSGGNTALNTSSAAGSLMVGRGNDAGATSNAFEDPSLADAAEGKAKKRGKKSKSGKKKKSRGKKKKAQASGQSGSGEAAESSDDESSSDDDELPFEEPDDNLVDSRFAPSFDVMVAERAREQLEAEERAAASRK